MADVHDTPKILKHLDRILMWQKERFAWPIFVDFDLTNNCNNRCPLCISKDRDTTTASFEDIKRILLELKEIDVKAMIYGGGGEPSCHPKFKEILEFTKSLGMEVGIFTNAGQLSDDLINAIVKYCTWCRISMDADSPEMYRRTHGMDEEAWRKVVKNIRKLVEAKKRNKSSIVIGNGYLIGLHTISGIFNSAKLSKELGVDYIRLRPFFSWEDSKRMSKEDKNKMDSEFEKSKELENKEFTVSCAQQRCESVSNVKKRKYGSCSVHNFMTSITPNLNMYVCCAFKITGGDNYCFGNLKEKSFKEIWKGEKRKSVCRNINLKECPNPCRFESSNELLWDIIQPMVHENFF